MSDIPAAARGSDWENGFLQRTLMLWDYSKLPVSNDREKKLGAGVMQRGGAIQFFDEDTNLTTPLDGIAALSLQGVPIPYNTDRPLEPDNWALRFHSSDGRGKDGVWALRLVADHDNHANTAPMRSTMVIDQGKSQQWGALSDLFWITDKVAKNADKELAFSPAGFLTMLYGVDAGFANARGALALNVAKNAGFVTDGGNIGPLAHPLRFLSAKGTAHGNALGARPGTPIELGLNAEAGYGYKNGDIVSWPLLEESPKGLKDEGSINRKVFFYQGEPGNDDPGISVEDPSSNHTAIPRNVFPRMSAYIKDEASYPSEEHHYDYSYHSDPPVDEGSGPSYVGPEGPPGEDAPGGSDGTGDQSADPAGNTANELGEDVASVDEHAGTRQCQHGHVGAESPALSQRVNIFPGSDVDGALITTYDILAAQNYTKPPTFTTIKLAMRCKISEAIAASKKIELNIVLSSTGETTSPAAWYRRAKIFTDTTTTGWQLLEWTFEGFSANREDVELLVIRRKAAGGATNSVAELQVERTSLYYSA